MDTCRSCERLTLAPLPEQADAVPPVDEQGCCRACGALLVKRQGVSKYDFGRLKVGQQLILPLDFRDPKAVVRVRYAAFAYGFRQEKRFSVTTVENGALVKRVA